MEKFNKDKNKIKSLKVRCGFPLFINYCYNQKIRNELNNSKLFIENNKLHYHLKKTTGGSSIERIDSSIQYVVIEVNNYKLNNNKIIINGNIEKINANKKEMINSIELYRIYQNENKIIDVLEKLHK